MDESSFRNPKLRDARLVAYKAFADAAGKGSVFLVTVVAARRLSPEAFGIFSLASTLGWILAVAADCGIQLHVARAVARTPARASGILSAWLRVRLWTTAAAIAVVMLGLIATQATLAFALPLLLFAIVYGGSGLIEFAANPYAAMPSLHAADALITGLILASVVRRPVFKVVWLLWPLWVWFAVMATANHFWLDVVAGVVVAIITLAIVYRARARRIIAILL